MRGLFYFDLKFIEYNDGKGTQKPKEGSVP